MGEGDTREDGTTLGLKKLASYSYSNLVRQTTDGATKPTRVWVVRGIDATSIENEIVICWASSSIVVAGCGRIAPIVARITKISYGTIDIIDIPATDEAIGLKTGVVLFN